MKILKFRCSNPHLARFRQKPISKKNEWEILKKAAIRAKSFEKASASP